MQLSRDDQAVIQSTRALLEATRRQSSGLAYAEDDWSPVADITLEMIARRFGAVLRQDDLPASYQELGVPAYFGAPVIVINRNLCTDARRLALRHGLAHLIAGELEAEPAGEVRFMSSALDWMTLCERRADLFAIADLIPDCKIADERAAGADEQDLLWWLCRRIASFAHSWPLERIQDRARLRLALWEEDIHT